MKSMKVLSLMTYDVFRLSFGWALESMGHKVYHLNRMDATLLNDAICTFRPDIVVTMGWDTEHGKLFELKHIIKFHRLFHLYFAEEDYLNFERWSVRFVRTALPDLVLTREKKCIPKYNQMNIKAEYFDVGCSLDFHRPLRPDPRYACDVSIVDHLAYKPDVFLHKSLSDLVVPLFNQPFDTKLWGRRWDTESKRHFGKSPKSKIHQGILPFHHTPRVYSSAKINISPQSLHDQISNRTYDILSSRGFLLTSDTPGVREKLTPGLNCEVSSSPEETVEKIAYYLKNEEKRIKIMEQGHRYARENFSYKNTLEAVWPKIESALKEHRSAQVNQNVRSGNYFIVKKGDTLNKIAKLFRTSVNQLKQKNGLKRNVIYVNQILKVK